jgi:hypothetical protein
LNYFPIEKGVEYVHNVVDRVHGASPWRLRDFIK